MDWGRNPSDTPGSPGGWPPPCLLCTAQGHSSAAPEALPLPAGPAPCSTSSGRKQPVPPPGVGSLAAGVEPKFRQLRPHCWRSPGTELGTKPQGEAAGMGEAEGQRWSPGWSLVPVIPETKQRVFPLCLIRLNF